MLNRIKDSVKLNHIFGKKVLFIEGLPVTKDKIFPFIEKNNVKKVFCLSPIDYKYSKYPTKTNQKEFEQSCKEVYSKIRDMKIKIVPHLHLDSNTDYKTAREKIIETINWFVRNEMSCGDEIAFGWWLECDNFDKICKEVDLKVSKRQLHFYDYWI